MDFNKTIDTFQDLSTNARINEYGCSCALLRGENEEAMRCARNAKIFRDASFKLVEEYIRSENESKE